MSDDILFEPFSLIAKDPFELEMMLDITPEWDIRWRRMNAGKIDVGVAFYNAPRLQYSSISYSNGVLIEGTPPKGSIVISVVQTKENCSFKNQQLQPYELIIINHNDEMDYLANGANTIFSLTVEESFFKRLFFEYFGKTLSDVVRSEKLIIKKDYMRLFISRMQSWLFYFEKEHRMLDLELYYSMEDEILITFFSFIEWEQKVDTKEKFDIAKAREILHANVANIYKISELVEELQSSSRTIQHNFKTKLGITPKQYLNNLKLNAIREELLKSEPEKTNISDVALKYGFFNASHFAYEYKKMFHESPSVTLKRYK